MKKIFSFLFCAIATIISGGALAETLTIDFEDGKIPDGWTASGVSVKKDNNSNRAAMSSNASLVSPAIKGMRNVAYKHRGSGSNKELVVEASTDGGSNWAQIGSTLVSSSSVYGSAGHSVNVSPDSEVMIRFYCKSGTIYVDDIELTFDELETEPSRAASLSVGDITGNSVSVNINKGNGLGRIVAYKPGNSIDWKPEDGVSFTGLFPKSIDDVTIIASGDVTEASATELKPGTVYTFVAYEYNGDGNKRNYLTDGANSLSVTTLTVPTISVLPASVDFMKTKVGGSKERSVNISAEYLEPISGKIIITSSSSAFTISTDGVSFGETASVSYTGGSCEGKVTVRFSPKEFEEYEAEIYLEGGDAKTSFIVKGKGADSDNREIFIAPDGDDNAAGTIDAPWLNLQKAVNVAAPGDIIYCRGGRYNFTTRDSSGKLTVRIKSSGTADSPITIRAYGDEQPIFDFEQQLLDCKRDRSKVGDRGILLTGNYWHLYGLHIMHAADNGLKLEGSHNRIERCEFSYNLDSGLQMGFGHNFSDSGLGSKNDGSFCAYNDIIDCDSHHNCDFDSNYGSDADGFACKMHNGEGNRFIRCRAWRNSDDAWDLYETDFSVVLIECWAWESGKPEDHTWVYDYFDKGPSFSGNGNGIKLGGNGTGGSSKGVHYAYNCIAFGNNKSGSTKGFDCNSHKDGHVVVGGLAFDNGYDFMFESGGGANSEFYNNVCFGRQEILVGKESNNALLGVTPQQGKTFFNNVVTNFSRSDYESLSEADALAPRGVDGSLPAKFGRLKSGSKLIDAGLSIEVPFTDEFPELYQPVYGLGRDLGPYELQEGPLSSAVQLIVDPKAQKSLKIIDSSFSDEVIACISSDISTEASLQIVSLSGQTVSIVSLGRIEGGTQLSIPVSTASFTPGIYVASLSLNGTRLTAKFIVR